MPSPFLSSSTVEEQTDEDEECDEGEVVDRRRTVLHAGGGRRRRTEFESWVPYDPHLTRTLARATTKQGPSSSSAPQQQQQQQENKASSSIMNQAEDNLRRLSSASVSRSDNTGQEEHTAAAATAIADQLSLARTSSQQDREQEYKDMYAMTSEVVDQLAAAIQEEVERLGEGPMEGGVMAVRHQDSIDLSNTEVDPDSPTIWFKRSTGLTRSTIESENPQPSPTQTHEVQTPEREKEEKNVLPLERQITLRFPTVITPSEHVGEFQGPLPADVLADIYAGRHQPVASETLHFISSFLRYAFAVYVLEPGLEQPPSAEPSLFDYFCCFGAWILSFLSYQRHRYPKDKVLDALYGYKSGVDEGSKEEESDERVRKENIELLYINCSNRVLSHLPYLIALDHNENSVVIAIRGTIGVADIITDAVVYAEVVSDWVPECIASRMAPGPALAHAGMTAAARAVFLDMKKRGVLPEAEHAQHAGDDDDDENKERLSGRRVGDIIRQKLHSEACSCSDAQSSSPPWKLVVVGHSLGAGVATLVSLRLLQYYPDLFCIAFSPPGALMSKNLSHAVTSFCTSISVGKDVVPRGRSACRCRRPVHHSHRTSR